MGSDDLPIAASQSPTGRALEAKGEVDKDISVAITW
jgi:hypothetical protein